MNLSQLIAKCPQTIDSAQFVLMPKIKSHPKNEDTWLAGYIYLYSEKWRSEKGEGSTPEIAVSNLFMHL